MRTYAEVARYFDVPLCTGCEWFSEAEHRRGLAFVRPRGIHWSERGVNKLGLRRFLLLVAQLRLKDYASMSPGMRLYASNVWAARGAGELHVRFPRRYSDGDRRRATYYARSDRTMTRAARRWAANTTSGGTTRG